MAQKKGIAKQIRKVFNVDGGIDILFFAFLMAILVIGLIMLYSASYVYAYQYTKNHDSAFYFKRQFIWVLLGIAVMYVISRINYKTFEVLFALGGTAVSWLLLGVALIMPAHNGTHRHIYIGSFQFQPSDLAKFALILTLACMLDKYHEAIVNKKPLQSNIARKVNETFNKPVLNYSVRAILLMGMVIVIYAGLVIAGSHLSGTILIVCIGVVMLYLGEVRGKWFVAGILAAALVIFIVFNTDLLKGYMQDRIYAWQNKDYDPLGARWQVNQALYAIGSGGLFGKGIGQSTLKHLYVSEPQNDMIFSIVVEEIGVVGAGIILILFGLLIWRGVVIGINCPDRYGALVAMGVVFQVGIQVVLNILVATDSIPNTGIPFPFFSYGGTAMLVNLAEMGFVLSISRRSKIRR
ncbi:MAG: FtsW/RodA/SpoVE family cell cycle protein [Clostridia bacterium]|nr:FtsW/RodA/SpoVE family cell cycle protein [Clostridia bacterium]